MLNSEVYNHFLKVFVLDEAHTIKTWQVTQWLKLLCIHIQLNCKGQIFRNLISRIGEIRSLLP